MNERFETLLQLLLKSSKKFEASKSVIIVNHLSVEIYHKIVAIATENKIKIILNKYSNFLVDMIYCVGTKIYSKE